MPGKKRLVIGLGNPGAEYEDTRHNIGFVIVDALAHDARISLKQERGLTLVGWGRWRSRSFGLAKPLTYMNRSGQAVLKLIRAHGLSIDDILVVVDDIGLPPGTVRIRQQGSAGGHNGVQDIIDRLGTNAFPRLRIGIGNDYPRGHQVDYVLSKFTRVEQPLIDEAVVRAKEAALTFVSEGLVTAMNRYNRK